jgi:hypothetical protein
MDFLEFSKEYTLVEHHNPNHSRTSEYAMKCLCCHFVWLTFRLAALNSRTSCAEFHPSVSYIGCYTPLLYFVMRPVPETISRPSLTICFKSRLAVAVDIPLHTFIYSLRSNQPLIFFDKSSNRAS